MRQHYQKFIFVGILVVAALIARGNYRAVSQSAADIVSVTASLPGAPQNGDGAPTVTSEGAALTEVSGMPSDTSTPATSFTTGASTFTRTGSDPVPALDYHEALVADLTSGEVLFGDHDASRWPMASLTKLMTASVAVDTLDMNQAITITPEAFAVDTSEQALAVGDRYSVSDLLRIMLLKSSNVAAEALAGGYGRTQFLGAMNARATALAMRNTYYNDASGLSSANQSTADDLLLLAQKISASYPQILATTRLTQATVTNLATGKKIIVKSINDFAGQPGFLGGKTGYTTTADGNLLSLFSYEKRPILIVIMGTDETARFDNTTTLYDWFKQNYK